MLKSEKILLSATAMTTLLAIGCFILAEPKKSEEIAKEMPKAADVAISRNPFGPVLVNLKGDKPKTEELVPEKHTAREVIKNVVAHIPTPPHKPKFKQAYQAIAAHFKTTKDVEPQQEQPQEALAYAPQENLAEKLFGVVRRLTQPASDIQAQPGMAVYKITDHKVYLPDGTQIEAHSGLGQMRDNPRYTHVRMRGPTPPHIYDLSWRERPFHGVKAIRLNPVGGSKEIHNRDGLLAHTYMLNPEGASNGCVSFRDYTPFQRAFEKGLIKRLAVIP